MPTTPVPPDDWTDPRHRAGLQAELDVADWLRNAGWTVEAHRFRLGRNDLDLIARQGDLVAFVEVKARGSARFGAGEEAVGPRKQRAIERVAWWWIIRHGRPGDRYRFDVATVLPSMGRGPRIQRIVDAWRPGWR